MSHIPASRMPRAQAQDDHIDGRPEQPGQAQPAPEPTTPFPSAAASGASPTSGGKTEAHPTASSTNGTSAADGDAARGFANGPSARDEDDRSPLAIAAMVIGGLAVVGGIVAALAPSLVARDKPKSKKRKKRKGA